MHAGLSSSNFQCVPNVCSDNVPISCNHRGGCDVQMLTVHYYLLFDGPVRLWEHMESFYRPTSSLA